MNDRPQQIEREAKEHVEARLALVSTMIWFIVTFGAAALFIPAHTARAPLALLLGFGALGVAALPWLFYRRLVSAAVQRALRPQ